MYSEKIIDCNKREVLVVELKAPKVKVSPVELAQAMRYAREIEQSGQTPQHVNFKIILVSSDISESGKYEIKGTDKADTLVFKGEEYKTDCIFIIKDTVSVTALLQGLEYDKGGIKVDRNMRTNIPGVFAAGDCTGKPFQLAKAAGEGNVAALSACDYLN
jgi:thioredoxin reductase